MKAYTALFILFFGCSCSYGQSKTAPDKKSTLSSLQLEFVKIPAGKFIMGSQYHLYETDEANERWYRDESPMHRVHISQEFDLLSTEVTRAQFEVFVKATGYKTSAERNKLGSLGTYGEQEQSWKVDSSLTWRNPGYKFSDKDPIVHVSWKDAKAFCYWLSEIDPGFDYDLPSEAEWEYAASAGGKNKFSWGNEEPKDHAVENIADQAFSKQFPNWKYPVLSHYNDNAVYVSVVKSYKPNQFGLYDISGNVWEWVNDYYTGYSLLPQVNPCIYSGHLYEELTQKGMNVLPAVQASERLGEKVIRGGGFDWEVPYLRTTKRRKIPVEQQRIGAGTLNYVAAINIGFRIKRSKKGTNKTCGNDVYARLKYNLTKLHFDGGPALSDADRTVITQVTRIGQTKNYYCVVNAKGANDSLYSYLVYASMPEYKYEPVGFATIEVFKASAPGMQVSSRNGEHYATGKETGNANEQEMKIILPSNLRSRQFYF